MLSPPGYVLLKYSSGKGETIGRLWNNACHRLSGCKLLCFGAKIGFRLKLFMSILRYKCTVFSRVARNGTEYVVTACLRPANVRRDVSTAEIIRFVSACIGHR